MLELNKDYILYTKYIDGKPNGIQMYTSEDYDDDFEESICNVSNIFNDFFNNFYFNNKKDIDSIIKIIESTNEGKFEKGNYAIFESLNPNEFFILTPGGIELISFEEFYDLRNNWEKAIPLTKEIVSVKEKIEAFKKHYAECYNKIDADKQLDTFEDRGIFIPILIKSNNELKEYIMFVNYIYYGYSDCEMDIYYYDCKNNRILKGIAPYIDRFNNVFKPYHKLALTKSAIETWYSIHESLIALYEYDKKSFEIFYEKFFDFLKCELIRKDYIKYFTEEEIKKFSPLTASIYKKQDNGTYISKKYIDG